ncbi:protein STRICTOSIDINE SYNTHASE-LIKE 10-like [Solanum stenotomum]|uniref:protein STRICTOSIDINE SYNTHASE-LIKE 10-like n=1 Tax=Solanum stenotomum TaxID=172797 RepID=UPI0020D1DC12|nr:protein STRICTOSIDINE SYNTHASE-LIKE 10-like [Solanum stenotomum]
MLNVSPSMAGCRFPAFSKLQLPLRTIGPEAAAFDRKGGGPYTGIADGRIVKYQGPKVGFTDFAVTSPNRTKAKCDGKNGPELQQICGRPFGLGFYYKTEIQAKAQGAIDTAEDQMRMNKQCWLHHCSCLYDLGG